MRYSSRMAESSSSTSVVDLDSDPESLARDYLEFLLARDSSGDEYEDLELETPFPTATQVEVEETVVDQSPEQVRGVVLDVRDHGPSSETDIDEGLFNYDMLRFFYLFLYYFFFEMIRL